MKYKSIRAIMVTLFLVTTIMFMGNCGSGNGPDPDPDPCVKEYGKWWWTQPIAEDVIFGVGTAKKQSPQLERDMSYQRAAAEVGKQVEIQIQALISDFMQESGIGDAAQALEFTEVVSTGTVNRSLAGCKVICRNPMDDGLYSLVSLPIDQIRTDALNEAKNAASRDEALYNEFKAKQGFEKLENKLDNMNGN